MVGAVIRRWTTASAAARTASRASAATIWALSGSNNATSGASSAVTAEYVRAEAYGAYSRGLVELIFVQPYCRIKNVVEAGIAQRQTAAVYLKLLSEVGVLEEVKVGREKLFINPRLMRLLTAEQIGDLTFPARA